jgi:flagellar basal body rod protein FlgF
MRITIDVPDEIPLEIIRDGLIDLVNKLNQHEEINGQLWIDPQACLEALEKMKQGDFSSVVEIKKVNEN